MVSNRCKRAVKEELQKLGLHEGHAGCRHYFSGSESETL